MAHFDNNCKILSHLGCSQLHTDKTNEFIFYFRINPETKKKPKTNLINDVSLSHVLFRYSIIPFSSSSVPKTLFLLHRRDGCVFLFSFSIFPHFVLRNISFAACPFVCFYGKCVCLCLPGFALNLFI